MTIYAIKKDGKLLIHTIAEWPRACMVVYLQDLRCMVYNNDTDETVEKLWAQRAATYGAEIVEIEVAEKPIMTLSKDTIMKNGDTALINHPIGFRPEGYWVEPDTFDRPTEINHPAATVPDGLGDQFSHGGEETK